MVVDDRVVLRLILLCGFALLDGSGRLATLIDRSGFW